MNWHLHNFSSLASLEYRSCYKRPRLCLQGRTPRHWFGLVEYSNYYCVEVPLESPISREEAALALFRGALAHQPSEDTLEAHQELVDILSEHLFEEHRFDE